jgi:two-component system, OmpR family, phosphate regulon response regulator PhoB
MDRRMLAEAPQKQILIIDRDAAAIEPLRERLSSAGYEVHSIADAAAALTSMLQRPPHLIIIDWNMPDYAVREVIEFARAVRPPAVRLILLSARSAEQDIVEGLNLGADDYIVKPFSVPETVARVTAILRCRRSAKDDVPAANPASLPGLQLQMRRAEHRLLHILMSHPGRVFTRAQLLSQLWSKDSDIDERTVDVNVQRLRKILAQPGCSACIQTVRGSGYRFRNG